MGHFSTSCAISGVTINGGDHCYFLPLIPQEDDTRYDDTSPIIISDDGASVFFKPYSLPILGTYDGYGGFEKPVKDVAYTKFKKLHSRVLNTRTSYFTENPDEKAYSPELKTGDLKKDKSIITGCFISKFAYDAAIQFEMNLTFRGGSVLYKSHITSDILEFAGFIKISELPEEQRKDNRYYMSYQKPDFPQLIVNCDGEFSKSKDYNGHTLDGLHKHCISIFKKPLFNTQELDLLSKTNHNEILINSRIKYILDSAHIGYYLTFFDRYTIIPFFFDDLVKQTEFSSQKEQIVKKMAELILIKTFMHKINKFFFPSYSGPQDGNIEAESHIAKAILQYNKEQKKIYG